MLFRYITRILQICIAGKTLAGYCHPNKGVFCPTVRAFLHEGNREKFNVFARTLFRNVDVKDLHEISRLLEFRDGMIASFLMHMPAFMKTVPSDDPVLTHVLRCARECGISKTELLQWGSSVKVRVESQNLSLQLEDGVSEVVSAALKQSAAHIVRTQEETNGSLAAMTQELRELKENTNE